MEPVAVFLLWGAVTAGFVQHALVVGAPPSQVLVSVAAFALLMGLYCVFSQHGVGELISWLAQPRREWTVPGLLWLWLALLVAMSRDPNAAVHLALGAVYLGVPTLLVVYARPALTAGQVVLGLASVLVPLIVDAALGRRLDGAEVALRAGAFALPVLLATLATRDQRRRLSFLFVSAVLVVWFAVEFDTVPPVALPPAGGALVYMRLAMVVLFLFVLARAGWLAGIGYSFALTRSHWREIAVNLALLGAIVLPIALLTGFVRPSWPATIPEMAARAAAIFFFIALPEELLFRGAIQRYLGEVLCWSPRWALGLASVIFGAAHLNNPPSAGWYAVLAAIAGGFYGRTYMRTRNIVAAAIVHTAVDWTWAVMFRP